MSLFEPLFEPLFAAPTLDGMRALSPKGFEHFVAYIFRRAGYGVADVSTDVLKGVDLELHFTLLRDARALGGVEVKRYASDNLVDKPAAQLLMGSPLVYRPGGVGFLITTSDFTPLAYEFAKQNPQLHLLNGPRFVRYIDYLRGSVDDHPDESTPPISPACILTADTLLSRVNRSASKIIVVANNKGGVGKTTTARYVGLGLAQSGQRVLLVDMDPQANLTQFALNTFDVTALPSPHLGTYFAGHADLRELPRQSPIQPLLWIIPSHPQLGRRDSGGSGRPNLELDFVRNLHETFASTATVPHNVFDWIILDTPPAVSLFTRAALAAADYVLVPARARDSSVVGTQNLLATREAMGALMGHKPKLLGGVFTHWKDDVTSQEPEQRIQFIFRDKGSDTLKTRIPMATAIEGSDGKTPWASHALRAYDDLVEEVLALCQ
jgi:chromosome partitioning protein